MDACLQSQAISYGICSGKCGTASTLVLPFHYYSPKLFIYCWQYVILAVDNVHEALKIIFFNILYEISLLV